ncbi:MAG: tetratricopeptide repeat protein [Polyangiaceae bacterium]
MKRLLGRGSCALASAFVLSLPALALADDTSDAREAFNQGVSLAAEKRWSEACDKYEESLRLRRSALTLYSLGVVQREAGRLVEAQATLEAFLAEPETPSTQSYREPARATVAELQARVAALRIVLTPAPVSAPVVTIDGETIPETALLAPISVNPGPHEIAARAPGRAEARSSMTLPEGGTLTVTLPLTPVAPGAPLAPSARVELSPPSQGETANRPWPRPLPFALMGAGGAALVAGVTVGLVGVSEASAAPSASGPEADAAREKGIAGDVLSGAGVATAGAGLVLLILEKTQPTTARARPWVRAGGAGLSVSF